MKPDQKKPNVLVLASVASMISQFNLPNIRLLQEMGYQVHVACNFKGGNTCSEKELCRLQMQLSRMRVKVHAWDCPRNIGAVHQWILAGYELWMLTKAVSFAWIHCQSPVGAALARVVAHRRGIRVIYTAHGFHFYRGAPLKNWLLYFPVEKLLSYDTDQLLTVNQEDYRFAKQHLNAKKTVRLSGVGVDLERFHTQKDASDARELLRRRYQIPQDAVILLSVGELNHGKNHKTVLDALAAVKRSDLHYMICGQGELRRTLRRYADRLGVGERVHLVGYQSNMPLFYQGADLFVFPSLREGMPMALMEAMAMGLPCLVSDIRGNRELICDPAMRFSPKSAEELCSRMNWMLYRPWLWKTAGVYNQRKVQDYQLDRVIGQMRSIYARMRKDRAEYTGKKPMVAVLIATYQPDFTWLRQLFCSIRRQSFQDFEILLMDDGSGEAVFARIRWLAEAVFGNICSVTLLRSLENKGSNQTFEKLALSANNPYLAFCDQDDIWESDKLERLVKEIRKQDAVLVYSDMSVIDADGGKIKNSLRGMRKWTRFRSGEGQTAAYIMDNCTAACSMLARREIVKKAAPFYQGVHCDQWIAACAAAFGRIAFVDAPLVRYRRHGNNQTETLAGIASKKDYYQKRIVPAYEMARELYRRGIRYPHERDIRAFVQARKQGNLPGIWKYRKYNRKYACFDLLLHVTPDCLVRMLIQSVRQYQTVGQKKHRMCE